MWSETDDRRQAAVSQAPTFSANYSGVESTERTSTGLARQTQLGGDVMSAHWQGRASNERQTLGRGLPMIALNRWLAGSHTHPRL